MCILRSCDGETRMLYQLTDYDVLHCCACNLMYRQPLPDPAETKAMYEDPAYHESAYFRDPPEEGSARPEMLIYESALDTLERLSGEEMPGSLLDVGCGAATFLRLAAARGWQARGVELSTSLATRASEEHALDVTCSDFLKVSFGEVGFSAITMWDFLEHVGDPEAALTKARDLLEPDGVLVILTIDSSSLFNLIADAGHRLRLPGFRRALELLYDARHNFYFTRRSLERLLASSGFAATEREAHRGHLGRWLSEPAPLPIRLVAEAIDGLSVPLSRQYRQLLYCVRRRVDHEAQTSTRFRRPSNTNRR